MLWCAVGNLLSFFKHFFSFYKEFYRKQCLNSTAKPLIFHFRQYDDDLRDYELEQDGLSTVPQMTSLNDFC